MSITPTGIPIALCATCNRTHPVTRNHCTTCNKPSLFIHNGLCIGCRESSTTWRKS